MQEGAFALIDCLGFKGIWNRVEDTKLVLDKLRKISNTAKELIHSKDNIPKFLESAGLHSDPNHIVFKTSFFSDTVFVGLQYVGEKAEGEEGEFSDALLVKTISSVVIRILDLFIKEAPFLLMRGCITYGEFICEGDFYAGPAVDEAAEHMNRAEGAFVWLHKSAARHYEKWNALAEVMAANFTPPATLSAEEAEAYAKGSEVIYYPMPIKEKGHLSCFVLNILSMYPDEDERRSVIDIYEKEMNSNQLDVWVKQQNTSAFLEVGNEVARKYYISEEKVKNIFNTFTENLTKFAREFGKDFKK